MKTMPILAFFPQEALPLLIVFAGFAVMFGMKKIAISLFTLCGLIVFLPVILEPFLEMLPEWALSVILILFGISMIGMILTLIIGRNARDQMVGSLAADVFKWILFLPFRVLSRLFRRPNR